MTLKKKYDLLRQIIAKQGKVIIAYSGGVDSTFLLKVAIDTLGCRNVLACIAQSPSLPKSQYENALKIAKQIGAEIRTVNPAELADPNFTANRPDRCFICKAHLLEMLNRIAENENFNHVLCGHNLDDEKDFRPGRLAMEKYGTACPLAQAKMTKQDIRKLSRKLNLPTADMPATPCLASRIAYGLEITQERLGQVEQAERFLREKLNLREFRVRHHGDTARIEAGPQDFHKFLEEPDRSQTVDKFRSLGFTFITLDLQGFRSGAMNEILSKGQK